MAIVENRSTEIGDVIRIRSEVPVVGLLSLTTFADDTEGEVTGGNMPGMIQPFAQGNRQNNQIFTPIGVSNIIYAAISASDGNTNNASIGAYSLTNSVWDLDYPDVSARIGGLALSGNFLYAFNAERVENTFRASLYRINLTTRVWELVVQNFATGQVFVGDRIHQHNAMSREIENDILWIIIGNRVASYNIATNTPGVSFVRVLMWEDIIFHNNRLYLTVSRNEPTGGQGRLAIFDATDGSFIAWSANISIVAGRDTQIRNAVLDAVNGIIYTINQRGTSGPNLLFSYNIATDTWSDNFPAPPHDYLFQSAFTNNRFYSWASQRTGYIFDVPSNTWLAGATPSKFFRKQFRYSTDGGFTFTDFVDLTMLNVRGVEVARKDSFVVDIAYTREGTDAGGNLTFNSVTLSGDLQELGFPIYDTTIFKRLFEALDPNVLGWALNVLEKLYQRGLLPDYIDRNRLGKNDEDFIVYWYSVTHLFAILVYWMRNFENIPANRTLLTQFLRNFDITLPFDLNLDEEAIIYSNRVNEYRRRGTNRITTPGTDTNELVDGELLRLIDWQLNDFFIFGLTESSSFGWCLGLSSPTWTGTANITNLIMGYEFTTAVTSLANYPLVGSSNIAIIQDAAISQNVMAITSYAGTPGTYGIDTGTAPANTNFLFPVNHTQDYEITFKVKKISTDTLNLSFSAFAYSSSLARVNMSPIDGSGTNVNSFQATPGQENVLVQNVYYSFNAIVHGSSTTFTTGLQGNFRGYRGLRMPTNAAFLGLAITASGTANQSDFYLYDIKVRPRDLPISQGLFGVKNIIVGYMDNGGELNDENARLFIQNKLIPYNSFLISKWL